MERSLFHLAPRNLCVSTIVFWCDSFVQWVSQSLQYASHSRTRSRLSPPSTLCSRSFVYDHQQRVREAKIRKCTSDWSDVFFFLLCWYCSPVTQFWSWCFAGDQTNVPGTFVLIGGRLFISVIIGYLYGVIVVFAAAQWSVWCLLWC